ncbi:efflux RND transporter permease subunit [Alteromonas sp. ASW11-19]|uniref:Efflux RND transporter permease subunit n=1 Tax=Alteromonas salexigens TaxID=2982530 RepID=A0ABT2VK11_9ALTE|nr:efflux RND transporter permease subunit [Alteromonas salexigens]MCU7553335.1 efflux RND transporter permease subunit [Alteromonas salexigens]
MTEPHHSAAGPWYTVFYRRGHLLALSLIIVLVAGLSALSTLPRLEDPRIDTRNALVITQYPGASAERVEALVTDVLEDRLREIYEIKEIRSTSRAGISIITLETQDWIENSHNDALFSEIRDTLNAAASAFPAGVAAPVFDEKRGATAFTLLLSLTPVYPDTTPITVTARLADELADRIRSVPGTELVRIYGAPQEEIAVTVAPARLAATGLSILQVSQAIAAADPKLPAGTLYTEAQQLRLDMRGALDGVSMVGHVPLQNDDGRYLRVSDVASVARSWRTPVQDMALHNGQQTVFVAARMQTTVRVDAWTEQALEAVSAFNAEFAGSMTANVVFEQNKYTNERLSGLTENLVMGCMVVMLVILVFMGLRASWIVGLALPLCASFALFSLSFYNEQIHQMSIFGMIIAIGLLIDNAIVITDEIRIKLQNPDNSRLQALTLSVRHLFAPLLASTLTTILGFMPIFLLNGNIGDFVSPIAISVVMALIGSLFLSLTLIAALAARYLPRNGETSTRWWAQGIQTPALSAAFNAVLAGWIKRPALVLPVIILVCLSGFWLSSTLPNVFFPSADRDQFEVYVWTGDGSNIQHTAKVVSHIDEAIRARAEVKQVTWLVGGSAPSVYYNQIMKRDNTPNFANAVVTATSVGAASQLIASLQAELESDYPEAQIVVRAFGQGPPIDAPLEVKVIGTDLAQLNALGQQVRGLMAQVPGVTQSRASITLGEPELAVRTDSETTTLSSLSLAQLAGQLQESLAGRTGGSVLEGTEDIPVRVRFEDSVRNGISGVAGMPVMSQDGTGTPRWVPLHAIGDLALMPSLSGITRLEGERVNRVQGYLLPGIPAVDASNALRDLIDKHIQLPAGYRIQMAGDADEQKQALGQLATYAPVLLVLMLTTLILTFQSVRMASVIGMVAVLSVGLGMASLWISGLPVGFNPLLGSAGLIGVAINGSIVVIAAINANPAARQGATRAIVEETMGCSRHILSTTFTTVGGLIPLLLFSEGSFWPPLAVVLAGGVGFSVMLSLVFTPTLVALFHRQRQRRQPQRMPGLATPGTLAG